MLAHDVPLEVGVLGAPVGAVGARVGLLAGVDELVASQRGLGLEGSGADGAEEDPRARRWVEAEASSSSSCVCGEAGDPAEAKGGG